MIKSSNFSVQQKYIVGMLFLGVFLIYVISPIVTPFDSRWSIFTSLSILHEGNTHLNEYTDKIQQSSYYAINTIDGNHYSIFPVGTSLLAIPFVAIAEQMLVFAMEHSETLREMAINELAKHGIIKEVPKVTDIYPAIEEIIASFYTALAVVFMFLIARLQLSLRSALFFALLFAFGTSAWSTSSRALWQHGPSMMLLAWSLYWLLQAQHKEHLIRWVAIPLAIAFIVRPTNAIPIFFFSIFILLNYRKQFLPYILVASPFAIAFFAYSQMNFGTWLPAYYDSGRVFSSASFVEALFGNLVSPARGLLIYSPIILFALPALLNHLLRFNIDNPGGYLAMSVIFHWLLISSFGHWWGGHSYGPRFFTDVLPFLFYFLIPVFGALESRQISSWFKRSAILISLVLSVGIHFRGAWHWDVYLWNTSPANIDASKERLWSWSDPQFLRFSNDN